mmetsp:Transcript_8542/g.12409  ORF Transcript_8542/g.12409 Transcript_8542/m.12409 type:complete len:108 (-) Transcript_8542:651-974(-)
MSIELPSSNSTNATISAMKRFGGIRHPYITNSAMILSEGRVTIDAIICRGGLADVTELAHYLPHRKSVHLAMISCLVMTNPTSENFVATRSHNVALTFVVHASRNFS